MTSNTFDLRYRMLSPILAAMLWASLWSTGTLGAQDFTDLDLEVVATGLGNPVSLSHAGDGRLFISLQRGRVLVFDGQNVLPQPFLDISGQVSFGGERGFYDVAFHPDYALNGYFFVSYTDPNEDTVIARYTVSTDPNRADPSSAKVLLLVDQPSKFHNGGRMQFGPDGYLYIGMGDGGPSNDPDCRAQDKGSILGKILRLDIDANADAPPYHGIPADNPFVDDPEARGEVWVYGLRNPWRFSFDRATGALFIGDVGQREREEISYLPPGSTGGENYGWKMMEGDHCTRKTQGCTFPIPGCDAPEYTPPILVYDHTVGCAVMGGFVYRGSAIPILDGQYLYGDLCSGRLWAAEQVGGAWQNRDLPITVPGLTSFGEDADGELYLTAGSRLLRLTGPPPPPEPSICEPDATTLCLRDRRFKVTVDWRTADANGAGEGSLLTPGSGFFWFFGTDNPEIFIKILDGCSQPSPHFWVFIAGLTDVGVTITVEDTENGQVRRYETLLGTGFEAVRDTRAFDTCP